MFPFSTLFHTLVRHMEFRRHQSLFSVIFSYGKMHLNQKASPWVLARKISVTKDYESTVRLVRSGEIRYLTIDNKSGNYFGTKSLWYNPSLYYRLARWPYYLFSYSINWWSETLYFIFVQSILSLIKVINLIEFHYDLYVDMCWTWGTYEVLRCFEIINTSFWIIIVIVFSNWRSSCCYSSIIVIFIISFLHT